MLVQTLIHSQDKRLRHERNVEKHCPRINVAYLIPSKQKFSCVTSHGPMAEAALFFLAVCDIIVFIFLFMCPLQSSFLAFLRLHNLFFSISRLLSKAAFYA